MTPQVSSDGKKHETIPRAIGQTAATLQHLTDLVIDWGFRKMKQAGKVPVVEKRGSKTVRTVKTVARPVLSFLGSVGESYYEWYEKLKARRAERK
ncbi:MAG: hypothetical protein PHS73_02490 [Candidatus Peribacteraceae bacterium]|nr:hypothetical protein [Candidatus Peribacteraceae bacterium]